MKRAVSVITLLTLATTVGCAAVLVGGLIWKSSKSQKQHEQWSEQFQSTNEERVKRGVKPLDWCIEAAHFDRGWAHQDSNCGRRIDRAQDGDTLALAYPSDFYAPPDWIKAKSDSTRAKPDSTKPH
jgi:hypothetical protein